RLARRYSPDVNFWEHDARALFEEIAEAYRILSDPTARSVYDRRGPRPAADVACSHCGGLGTIWNDSSRVAGVCPACDGAGIRVSEPCRACRGRGVSPSRATVHVVLPPGLDTGAQLRVPG